MKWNKPMKIVAHISSNGNRFAVRSDGCIAPHGSRDFSLSWKLNGAIKFNNFGYTTNEVDFDGVFAIQDWHYKNGKQKWHIVDYDHGTKRVWMKPNHCIITVD